ncbi:MAG: type III pantothenate kinase [Sulfuricurvum sp.]|uniref:type III pantothenate kinase n=1 Tax=Sulfuricurvum sp. TaxID=2025608 RepID=UPI00260DB0C1|nr:type III pantothenate kinase [Sulfuricurvum sp.]MDD2829086.1 type III pantothenate kinase [Sulfuricurvum sp.]MDD4948834.1 type III pantothenate kinase [Sulfuricurvum sp.]
MICCDIGNTTADIYEKDVCRKVLLSEFKPEVFIGEVWYVNVNQSIQDQLETLPNWYNIELLVEREKYYSTMGLDRIMVCEAIDDGVIVDAGSAITVDVMQGGVYQGGFIALGLRAAQEAYAKLSPALDMSFNFEVDLAKMAKNTPDALSIGFLAPLIEKIEGLGKPIYVSGGDARLLSRFFREAKVDENLIFTGMKKLIDKGAKC